VATSRDISLGVDDDQTEGAGVYAGQFRNIARDFAAVRPRGHSSAISRTT
jgi:hypothetical protein